MYRYLNVYTPNAARAGALEFSAEIFDELSPADACEGESIDFVYTGIGAVSVVFEFEGAQYGYRYSGAFGDTPRAWIDLDDDSCEGLTVFDEQRCEDTPIELPALQRIEAAAGGARALFDGIHAAACAVMRAAQPYALDFLRECREEESAA